MVRILNEFFIRNPLTGDALKFLSHYPQYIKKYNSLKESQWWSTENFKRYQLIKLRDLLNHAYQNVPYYKSLFDEHNINSKDITSLEDFQKIPYLTKDIIRKNIHNLRAKNYPQYTFEYVTSGGTTGYPLGIYFERGAAEAKFLAFYQRMMNQSKCHISNKHAYLMSEDFIGDDQIYKYQLFRRILYLSSFHLNDENLNFFINKLKKHKPRYIVAYPSAIFQLARYLEKNNIDTFPKFRMILCSGETLYDWQREQIEKTFNCRVHSLYSHNEQTVFATTCNYSNYYHINPEYGITELIKQDGKYATKENELGEIVGTGFNNYVFPLIRYKTRDVGIYSTKKCECGRNFQLLKAIQGRFFEFIITKNNCNITLNSILNVINNCSKNVKDWQIIQDTKGEVVLKIIRDDEYSNKDEQLILKSLKKKFIKNLNFTMQYTNQIPLAPSGKKIYFIQNSY